MVWWRTFSRMTPALVLSLSLLMNSGYARPGTDFATVVYADSAQIGRVALSPGATVFAADFLATSAVGGLQIRVKAARVVLSPASRMIWSAGEDAPGATIRSGTLTFSTANSKAFTLRAGTAVIRPIGEGASIGSVTLLNPKELIVACPRGSLLLTVIDDSLLIPDGSSYHIVLDPGPCGGRLTGMGLESAAETERAKPFSVFSDRCFSGRDLLCHLQSI